MCDKLDELKRVFWSTADWSAQQTAIENILAHVKDCPDCKKNQEARKVVIMKGAHKNGL
jgi:uracil-DNA glycosylase